MATKFKTFLRNLSANNPTFLSCVLIVISSMVWCMSGKLLSIHGGVHRVYAA